MLYQQYLLFIWKYNTKTAKGSKRRKSYNKVRVRVILTHKDNHKKWTSATNPTQNSKHGRVMKRNRWKEPIIWIINKDKMPKNGQDMAAQDPAKYNKGHVLLIRELSQHSIYTCLYCILTYGVDLGNSIVMPHVTVKSVCVSICYVCVPALLKYMARIHI